MILADTRIARVSDAIGDGVFATRRIPRGTIVWTQDSLDRVFSAAEAERLPKAAQGNLERYAHRDVDGNYILCWDAGKLINHCCNPTLRGMGPWFQVARRDLEPGDELTCDYAECNLDATLGCNCGIAQCRRRVHGADLLRFAADWNHEAEALLADVARVAQPLWPHLLDPVQAKAWLDGSSKLPSYIEWCAFGTTSEPLPAPSLGAPSGLPG